MSLQAIRGFKDILPGEIGWWHEVERAAAQVFETFGYSEIRIPVVEKTELFARSIGGDTDIVEKEMYSFPDRRGDSLTLRPEATAGVVRSVIQHSLAGDGRPLKVYSIGPMFRYERPQMGRQRQFHQLNVEFFNVAQPYADVEVINLLSTLLNKVGLEDVSIHINSLGCPNCRPAFQQNLQAFLKVKLDQLCPDCQRRFETNPLRILDCKVETCKEAVKDAPVILDTLDQECRQHFDIVKKSISGRVVVDPKLVRGLDYYNRTVFEARSGKLGAQNAVGGGGRYDGLVKSLGGPDIPALGFAVGLERLIMLVSEGRDLKKKVPSVFIAAIGDEAVDRAFDLVQILRENELYADMEYSGASLKSQMRRAGKLGAKKVLIIGPDELEKGKAILRNMAEAEQEELVYGQDIKSLAAQLTEILKQGEPS